MRPLQATEAGRTPSRWRSARSWARAASSASPPTRSTRWRPDTRSTRRATSADSAAGSIPAGSCTTMRPSRTNAVALARRPVDRTSSSGGRPPTASTCSTVRTVRRRAAMGPPSGRAVRGGAHDTAPPRPRPAPSTPRKPTWRTSRAPDARRRRSPASNLPSTGWGEVRGRCRRSSGPRRHPHARPSTTSPPFPQAGPQPQASCPQALWTIGLTGPGGVGVRCCCAVPGSRAAPHGEGGATRARGLRHFLGRSPPRRG